MRTHTHIQTHTLIGARTCEDTLAKAKAQPQTSTAMDNLRKTPNNYAMTSTCIHKQLPYNYTGTHIESQSNKETHAQSIPLTLRSTGKRRAITSTASTTETSKIATRNNINSQNNSNITIRTHTLATATTTVK